MVGGTGCGGEPCLDCSPTGTGTGEDWRPGNTNGPGGGAVIDLCCSLGCAQAAVFIPLSCYPPFQAVSCSVGCTGQTLSYELGATSGGEAAANCGFGCSPLACVCALGSTVDACACLFGPSLGAGGGICGLGGGGLFLGADGVVWEFPDDIEVNSWAEQQLWHRVRQMWEINRPLLYQLGNAGWGRTSFEDKEVEIALIAAIFDAAYQAGPSGLEIDAIEYAALLGMPRPDAVTEAFVVYSIERWNPTLSNRAKGWE